MSATGRARLIAIAMWLVLGAAFLHARPLFALAFTQHIPAEVSFPRGSSTLSDPAKIELARHLPQIHALAGAVLIAVGYSDDPRSGKKARDEMQLQLAIARARAVREFFINAGFQEQLVHAEGKLATEHEAAMAIGEAVGQCASPICQEIYPTMPEDLFLRGRQFRSELDRAALLSRPTAQRGRAYDSKDVCDKYISPGLTFSDLSVMLRAARMTPLQPYRFEEPGRHEPGRRDVRSNSLPGKIRFPEVHFEIVVRPADQGTAHMTVGALVSCTRVIPIGG